MKYYGNTTMLTIRGNPIPRMCMKAFLCMCDIEMTANKLYKIY